MHTLRIHNLKEIDALIVEGERVFYIIRPPNCATTVYYASPVLEILLSECNSHKGQIFLGKLKADEDATLEIDQVRCLFKGNMWIVIFGEQLQWESFHSIIEGVELFLRTVMTVLQKPPLPVHMFFVIAEKKEE